MSIDIVALRDATSKIIGYSIVIEEESIPGFKEMVNRAFNCWADAPPELKSFADKVTHGRVLQNYFEQSKLTTQEELNKNLKMSKTP